MWDIAMFSDGTIGGSGYNFDISFFNESEINMNDDPCGPYGLHLICVDRGVDDSSARIDNGIIVTDKWILTSATTCLNIYNNPWNDYFIQAGQTNLTGSETGSVIKDYHIYAKENESQNRGCNQHDDYCLIELETALVISENIKAIGFQDFSGATTPTMTTTTTWDSTWHPWLTTTVATTTTTSSTITTTTPVTTTSSTIMNDRKKRQATTTSTMTTPTTTTTTLTTTTSTTTTSTTTTSATSSSTTITPTTTTWTTTTSTTTTTHTTTTTATSRCWIAAWSDRILRTFKADVDNRCFYYDAGSHISFRKNKLSTKEQVNLRKKIDSNKGTSKAKNQSYYYDHPLDKGAEMGNNQRSHNDRSHLCLDNLRKVFIYEYGNENFLTDKSKSHN